MSQRTNWDTYFLKLAMLTSERSTCPSLQSGCVITKDNQVLSIGFNGSIPGGEHCEDVGCLIDDDHCQRTISAEINAILYAAKYGKSINDSVVYLTTIPDYIGAQALITVGVKRVVSIDPLKDPLIQDMFFKTGIPFEEHEAPFGKLRYQPEDYNSAVSFEPV